MVLSWPITSFSFSSLSKFRLQLSITQFKEGELNLAVMSSEANSGDQSSIEDGIPHGIKVLVIDDDQVSLQVVCAMLERCGYKATKCTSGTEGLEMLRQNEGEFDIVLTDVHMPDMDGFQLLEQVGLEMDIPVVMLSEDSSHETMVKGLTHGACDYLIKPVQMRELEKIGEHVLTWRRANAGIDSDYMDDEDDEDDEDDD